MTRAKPFETHAELGDLFRVIDQGLVAAGFTICELYGRDAAAARDVRRAGLLLERAREDLADRFGREHSALDSDAVASIYPPRRPRART